MTPMASSVFVAGAGAASHQATLLMRRVERLSEIGVGGDFAVPLRKSLASFKIPACHKRSAASIVFDFFSAAEKKRGEAPRN